jgi:hypothetical protein
MELPAADFDGAWKYALDHYLPACLALFFPWVHAGIDWSRPVTDEPTALQQINPEATKGKQQVDKLVQVVRRDGTPALVFVHLEIQAQRDAHFAKRMYRYHTRLFDRSERPVASLAILADDDPAWHPTSFGYELWQCRIALDFPTVKLLNLDMATLEVTPNPMATLTLIHRDAQETRGQPEERMRRKLARFRAFFRSGYQAADLRHLYRLLDQLLRLPASMQAPIRATMRQIEQEETNMQTFMSDIEVTAYAEGESKGQQQLILRQLTRKLGALSAPLEAKVTALPPPLLIELSEALLDFNQPADLDVWLGTLDTPTWES